MKFLLLLLLAMFCASARNAIAQQRDLTYDGYFKTPGDFDNPENPQWEQGSKQTIEWIWTTNTPWANYKIKMYQAWNTEGWEPIYSKMEHDREVGSYTWVVTLGKYNLSVSNVFRFVLFSGPGSHGDFWSHAFNITTPMSQSSTPSSEATATVLGAPSSLSNEPSPPSTLTASETPTTAPTLNAEQQGQGSVSDHLPLALGVGLGVGFPLVLLLGIYVGLKIVRARTPAIDPAPGYVGPEHPPDIKYKEPAPIYHEAHEDVAPVELPSPAPQNARFFSM